MKSRGRGRQETRRLELDPIDIETEGLADSPKTLCFRPVPRTPRFGVIMNNPGQNAWTGASIIRKAKDAKTKRILAGLYVLP